MGRCHVGRCDVDTLEDLPILGCGETVKACAALRGGALHSRRALVLRPMGLARRPAGMAIKHGGKVWSPAPKRAGGLYSAPPLRSSALTSLHKVFSPRGPQGHKLPCKGRGRNPPPAEAAGPLHGTAHLPPLFRASGVLLAGPVGRAPSFVALPAPKPQYRGPGDPGPCFFWGLGATYLRAPGARAAYAPVTPLAHLATWAASRAGGPLDPATTLHTRSTYPSRRPPHRNRGHLRGRSRRCPPLQRALAREQQSRRELVAALPRAGGWPQPAFPRHGASRIARTRSRRFALLRCGGSAHGRKTAPACPLHCFQRNSHAKE